MNISRSTLALLGTFTLSASLALGQANLSFQDVRVFRVTGPDTSEYLGGSWNIAVNDGTLAGFPCFADGGVFFVPPTLGCAAGTTGLVTSGDLDGDGIRDSGQYFSLVQPIGAINIEPFQTDLVQLTSAPPSDLPRPLGSFNWIDNSITVFWDLVNNPVNGTGFDVTRYQSSRPYGPNELERQRDEIVPGTYNFAFPILGANANDPRVFTMIAPFRGMVEAFPGSGGRSVTSSGIPVGNDFRVTNDEDLWSNEAVEFDPRIVFSFEWEGFNGQTFVAGDRVFFSLRDRVTDAILFPPFPPLNPTFPQLIGSSALGIPTNYELGPGFFVIGQELVAEIEFRRGLTSGNTQDISSSFFRWNIDLIDTYDGFLRAVFPLGSSDDLVSASSDFDGDGFTNLQEFGLQTDPLDPAAVPNPTPTLDPITNQCILEVLKRPGVGSRLLYVIEYSLDLETWIVIEPGDPVWAIVFDNEERITVLSRRPVTDNPCFTRVTLVQN